MTIIKDHELHVDRLKIINSTSKILHFEMNNSSLGINVIVLLDNNTGRDLVLLTRYLFSIPVYFLNEINNRIIIDSLNDPISNNYYPIYNN